MSNQQLSMTSMELNYSSFRSNLLVSPHEVDFGTEEQSEHAIAYKNIEIRLGDRPLCRDLRQLYEQKHQELPADIQVFGMYDIWLITHCIHAIDRKGGSARITALGYEADFEESKTVYTVDLLPQTKFVSPLEGSFTNKADLYVEGNAKVPEAAKQFLDNIDYVGGDARINLSSELKMVGNIEFSVKTPIIQAIGIGSSHCEWMFEEDQKPLLGEQIMLQTILVPRYTEKLLFKIRGYALIKSHWLSFSARFYTDWLDVEVILPSDGDE